MCLVSFPWSLHLSRDVLTDSNFPGDKPAVPGDTIKGTSHVKITAECVLISCNSVEGFATFRWTLLPPFSRWIMRLRYVSCKLHHAVCQKIVIYGLFLNDTECNLCNDTSVLIIIIIIIIIVLLVLTAIEL